MKIISIILFGLLFSAALLLSTAKCHAGYTGDWPTVHPANAVNGVFLEGIGSSQDQFKIFVWRENSQVWIEIEPINNAPFICESSFSIVQNNIQYDDMALLKYSGGRQCGDVYTSAVYRFSYYLPMDNPPDRSKSFTLFFDGMSNTYSLDIPIATPTETLISYYVPFLDLRDDSWTGLALQNTSDIVANVKIYLYSNTGEIVETEVKTIPAYGQTAISLGVDIDSVGWVKVTSNVILNGLALIGNATTSTMYDIDLKSKMYTAYNFPHVVSDADWDSIFMLCNPNDTSARVTFNYFAIDGSEPYSGRFTDIPANGSLQLSAHSIFGVDFQGGSVKVKSRTNPITGFMLYDGTKKGLNHWKAGLSAIPVD